jgi:thioredoxin 1
MSGEKMIPIEDANFCKEVEQATTPVLVDFGATWCEPCKTLGTTIDSMADNYTGQVKFCYVDIQKAPMAAQRFGVLSVPTLVLFSNGAPRGSLHGAQPKGKIEELLHIVL